MIAQLDTMPDHARLWVYQAGRKLSDQEIQQVAIRTTTFLEQWAAHGQELRAAFEIKFNQFLVIAVDESMHGASGCSIDSCVGMVRELEQALSVSFMDRTKVALLDDDKVQLVNLKEIRSNISSGTISEKTVVTNNAVSSYGDFKKSWALPATKSWVARYFD